MIAELAKYMPITSYAAHSAQVLSETVDTLKRGVQLIVGTPARINDLIERDALNLDKLKLFIIDETDQLYARGYKDAILDCYQEMHKAVQIGLFSATFPERIMELSSRLTQKPVRILAKKREILTLDATKHYYVCVEKEEWKKSLDHALEFYISTEEYEECSKIKNLIDKL